MQASSWFVRFRLLAAGALCCIPLAASGALAPTNITLSALTVPEGAPPDVVVGTLTASDPDPGDTHWFTLSSGSGDTSNPNCRITGNELRLIYGVEHDFEAGPYTFSVRIKATDSSGRWFDKAFVISVSDSRTEDADGDGLTEAQEEDIHGTSDVVFDTDGDGVGDGAEVAAGTSAANPAVWPATAVSGWGNNAKGELGAPIGGGIVSIATGQNHSLSLNTAGQVSAWGGSNTYGQLAVPSGLQNVAGISAGGDYWLKDSAHSVAVRSDGTVAAWGYDYEGNIVVPTGLTDVVEVSAGRSHCLALKNNGTVVAWGYNPHGASVQPPFVLDHVIAISAGGFHSLALKSDGTVAAWGNIFDGTLWIDATVPAGLCDVVAISAGRFHSLALKRDGTVVAWGYNVDGQANVPGGLQNVVTISAGGFHSMALRADGSVVTWGSNAYGQLSVPASAQSGVKLISAGIFHSLAVKQQSGFPSITSSPFLLAAPGDPISHQIVVENAVPSAFGASGLPDGLTLDPQTGLISGVSDATRSTVHIRVSTDQGVLTQNLWLGVSTGVSPDSISLAPAAVAENSPPGTVVGQLSATDPDAGDVDFTYELVDGDGAADNYSFHIDGTQLVVDSLQNRDFESNPAAFTIRVRVRDASLNPYEQVLAVAFTDDRTEDADGDGLTEAQEEDLYQTSDTLADSDQDGFSDPFEVGRGSDPASAGSVPTGRMIVSWGADDSGQCDVPSGLAGVISLAAGGNHSLALTSDGMVHAWGANWDGQTEVPVDLADVIAVSAGDRHSLALKSDGTVVAWGADDLGQCEVPSGLTGVVAVSAGNLHNLALKSDGSVVAWGFNGYGQATVSAGLTDVVAIAAGGFHSMALKSDGTVVVWGSDWDDVSTVPSGLQGVVAIAAGGYHCLALKHDGTVVGWGSSAEGQIQIPVGLTGVKSIAAGWFHSLVLKSDGTVLAWGENSDGQASPPQEAIHARLIACGRNHNLLIRQQSGFPAFLDTSPLHSWPGESVFRMFFLQNATATAFSSMGLPADLTLHPLGGYLSGTIVTGERRAVRISADTDQGMLSSVIWVNTADGSPPTDITLAGNSVVENSPSGTLVGSLSADDPNAGDAHSFELVTASGAGDSYRFAISGNQLLVSGPLTADADAGSTQLFIRIRAIDLGNNAIEKNFALTLIDDRNEDADGDGFSEAFEEDVLGSSDSTAGDLATSDSDRDGTPAILEYAFNLNPKVANLPIRLTPDAGSTAGLPAVTLTGTGINRRLRLEYLRRVGSTLTYIPQFSSSTTSESWQTATGVPTVTPIDANWERCVIEDSTTISSSHKRFARVKLTW